ncbi:unnamed protein product [Schistosoma turkestanicum]|nr:unnamed protein product [Schistosoma turkestanicum]
MPTSWFPFFLPSSVSKSDQYCGESLRLELNHLDYYPTENDTYDQDYSLYVFAFDDASKMVLSNIFNFGKLKKERKKDGCVRLQLRQTLYFYSSDLFKSTLFVIVLTRFDSLISTDVSEIGWCSLNIHEIIRSSSLPYSCSSSFSKGSCRVLYLSPEVCNTFPEKFENQCIYYSIDSFKELENYPCLIPENKFVSSLSCISGANTDRIQDTWDTGGFVKIFIEDISITSYSSQIADFENYLCSTVSDDLVATYNHHGISSPVRLQVYERRFKTFLHNRYTILQPVPVIYLDTVIESERGSSSGRKISPTSLGKPMEISSTVSSESSSKAYLVARNDAELTVPQNLKCAVVFVLEYVLSDINSSTPKKFHCTVRWAAYPLEDNMGMANNIGYNSVNLNLLLQGSVKPSTVTDSNIDLSSSSSINGNKIQISDSDDYEKCLLRTVCPDGSFCFTDNVRSTMELTLNCTISVGIRKEMSENAVVEESALVTKQSKPAYGVPEVEHQFSGRESLPPESPSFPVVPRKKKMRTVKRKSSTNLLKKNDLVDDFKQFENLQELNLNSLPVPIRAQFNLQAQLLQQQQQQHQMGLFNPYSGFLNYGMLVGPYLGGIGPTMYQPMEPISSSMIGPFLNRNVNNSFILLDNIHHGVGLSRAAYAKIYSAGFEPIQTETGEPPFTIDPQTDIIDDFKFVKEEIDKLDQNEIIFQFLAYSGSTSSSIATDGPYIPEQIYFTFQFYRFPQVKTPTLFIGQSLDNSSHSKISSLRILWKSKNQTEKSLSEITLNSTNEKDENKLPGYKVVFRIDPNYFKPGEMEIFFNYLLRTTMQIDVWNAKSHILIGTCMVELRHLCRQGREAVQITYSMDILHSNDNVFDDESYSTSPPDIQGCLLLRLANIGHRRQLISKEITIRNKTRKKYLISQMDATCFRKFTGDDLSNLNCLNSNDISGCTTGIVVRAHKIKPTNIALQEMMKVVSASKLELPMTTIKANKLTNDRSRMKDVTRMEKLERLHSSLKPIEGLKNIWNNTKLSENSKIKALSLEKKPQLDTISQYRDKKKHELFERLINNATTIEHELHTSFGCTEFFEYQLKNPFNSDDNVNVNIEDKSNSLSFVTDPREVRALKLAFNIDTPTEDDLFALDLKQNYNYENNNEINDEKKSLKRNNVILFLKSNETVLIPMKYEEFTMFHTTKQYDGVNENFSEYNPSNKNNLTEMKRVIQVIFKSTTYGKIISQLLIHIHIQPPIIDHSFRFFHPELSFMKKILRLPRSAIDWRNNNNNNNRAIQQANQQIWVRVSDPDVLTLSNVQGDVVDLLIKVGLGKSPQVREFLISVYVEPFQIRPAYVWYWAIHSLQRVDAIATVGQLSPPIGLLLRTDDCISNISSKRITVYTSHPNEVFIGTEFNSNNFQKNCPGKELTLCVSSRSVYELKIRLCPKYVGKKIYQINVVDTISQCVVRAWILCVDARQPEITKSFNIKLPKQQMTTTCNKRIAYTNPYQYNKTIILETNRSDLVQFKESIIEIPAAETIQIGLHFIPQATSDSEQIYIFIKDEQSKNLETFLIIAQYY